MDTSQVDIIKRLIEDFVFNVWCTGGHVGDIQIWGNGLTEDDFSNYGTECLFGEVVIGNGV